MSDNPQTTWVSLIAVKRNTLLSQPEPRTSRDAPRNPAEFRTIFEQTCEAYRQTRATRYLGGFQRHFQSILAFSGEIDGANCLSAPDTLTSLVWEYAHALIATAFRYRVPLAELESTLRPYNKSVPNFGAQLAHHPAVPSVQNPLQRLYSEYLDCYAMMLKHFATCPPPLSFEPIKSRFDTATAIFNSAKEEWDNALRDASEAAERRRQQFISVPSVPNGLDGQGLFPQTTNAHFEYLRYLGHGANSQVSEVRECTTKQVYACKLVRARPDSRSQAIIEDQIKSEVANMQKLRHPHIASVLFYVRDQAAFSIIMLPVADYDLLHYLDEVCPNGNRDTLRQLDSWFGCLIVALTYVHHVRVKHHDIKPSNILIKNNQPYLTDFGSAKDFSELDTSALPSDRIAGTPTYFAPEKSWGRAADVFALGCVFSEMLTVRAGRTLTAYRHHRVPPGTQRSLAFCENLPKVREWMSSLEESLKEPLNRVCRWTVKMLSEDQDERCEAKEVKRGFRVIEEIEQLFCSNCI